MDQKARARERTDFYKSRILEALQAGPLSAMAISNKLDGAINITYTSMYLMMLEKEGMVRKERWERHRGRDVYAIWAMVNHQNPATLYDRTLRIVKGIDMGDIEWMKFWRTPRAERRRALLGEQ